MSLRQVGHYNRFSPKFRKELEDRVKSFGESVRYKFNVARPNPDPTKTDGAFIYPNVFTLDPVSFNITDKHETRENESTSKLVMLVVGQNEKGEPNKYKKIKAEGKHQCVLYLDLTNDDDFQVAMCMELHPKNESGLFPDAKKYAMVVTRIDEVKDAKALTAMRTEKRKALNAIEDMKKAELVQFADAMQWDSNMDEEILRNQAEELAEQDPKFFNDLIADKIIEYRALAKQAVDRKVISFDPADGKIIYASNSQPITFIHETADKNYIDLFAEWLEVGGTKAEECHKKIKGLLHSKPEAVA